ncbi:acyl-CoA wax alcohol acyltransferase 2 [Molossus molossus]|uniref:Acyltransferase n=1 Tax=Molossus molossus TaxID=27622 RepID=A0A7J8J565_MOLMO|nr:acyl-CoA wax alcohol acyltransferase 2 [Molossus molossus]KAF6491798.1 acyl-CoA wax alcohol acyltransferase 2 [Molossus molossus]
MFLPSKKDLKTTLEVFALFQWTFSALIIATLIIFVNVYLLLFTRYWPVPVLIIIWLAFDWKTQERGGRRFNFMRSFCLWNHYRDYFPVKLLKTHDISPDQNYILVCHPHGFLAHSWFSNFATETTGFSKLFPGITPDVLTLGVFFWLPLLRDYVMALGLCSVSPSSIDYLLTHNGTGNMLVVVVGGLAECRLSFPGCTMLFLKNRNGFVRKALQHGVPLIPAYSFGEMELYDHHVFTPGSLVSRFQQWFQRMTHIYLGAFSGRGFTENSWGLLPYARPLTTIVGEPLPMPKIEKPSREEVDKYHMLYVETLQKLFNQHKTKFGIPETQKLMIV